MDPDDFAAVVLRRTAANRAIIVVPMGWHAAWVGRMAPWLAEWAAERAFRGMKRDLTDA